MAALQFNYVNTGCNIIFRGNHLYHKVNNSIQLLNHSNTISVYCYELRCLMEVCEGILTWFVPLENLKIFEENSDIDLDDVMANAAKNAMHYGLDQGYDKEILNKIKILGKKKKYFLPDNKNKLSLKEIRKERGFWFSDSNKLLSKIAHQDEFSIGTIYIYTDYGEKTPFDIIDRIKSISSFWKSDYLRCLNYINSTYPEIIKTYQERYPNETLLQNFTK